MKTQKIKLSEYDKQALDFAERFGVTLKIRGVRVGSFFDDEGISRHIFKLQLKSKNGSYTFEFGQSIAYGAKEPTLYSVLACMQKYDVGSIEDFAGAFGYELRDPYTGHYNKATAKTYRAVCKEYEAMCRLFDEEAMEALQEIN